MCSPPSHPRMLFEKWELFVDDNEAPLPDPFDYSGHDGGPGLPLGEEELDPEGGCNCVAVGGLPDGMSVTEFTDMVNSTEMCSPSAHPRMLFEKWQLFVDDNEAPLPDPFDYSDHDNSLSPPPKGKEPDPEGRCLSVVVVGLPDGVSAGDFIDMVNLTKVIVSVLLVIKYQGKGPPAHIIFNISPVTGRIMFEKGELGVDDNEAPLPEPFDLVKQCDEGEDSDADVPEVGKHKARPGGSIEVQNRKENRNYEGTKRTEQTTELEEGEQPKSKQMQQETVTGFTNEREDSQAKEALKAEPSPRFVFENLSELGQVLPCLGWQGVGPGFRWGLGEVLCRAKKFNELTNDLGGPKYDRIGYEGNLHQVIDYAHASPTVLAGLSFQIDTFPNLSSYFSFQYEQTGDIGDLHQSIEYGQQELSDPRGCDRAAMLCNLAFSLSTRYERTGAIDDLHQAIEYGKQALVAITQPRAIILNNLSGYFNLQYEQTGDIGDLHQSIEYGQQALSEPEDCHERAATLCNLGNRLRSRYEWTGAIDDIHQAIEYSKQALVAIPQPHPYRATILNNLSGYFNLQSKQTGDIGGVHQSIEYGQQSLSEAQDCHDQAMALSNLGVGLRSRYERTRAIDDIHQAIEYSKQALVAIPQPHPYRAIFLNNLSSELLIRHKRTGDIGDLHQSIEYSQQGLSEPRGRDDQAITLSNLGVGLSSRHQQTGAIDDLHQAIQYARLALTATPPDHTSRACRLNNLGNYLGNRYECTGDIDDLQQAIEYGYQAKYAEHESAARQQIPTHRAYHMCNLSTYLGVMSERTGCIDNLQQAIEYIQQEYAADTTQSYTAQTHCLKTLGDLLRCRYRRTGAIDDLHQAIKYTEQALAATPWLQDHAHRNNCLGKLGKCLAARYERTGAIRDLHQAIEYSKVVLAATPEGDSDRATFLGNLSNGVYSRYKLTGATGDLHQAIEYSEQALAATPQGHTYQVGNLNNLSLYLSARYIETGTIKDLYQAIEYTTQALAATPEGDTNRAACLTNMSEYLRALYNRTGAIDDLRQAIEYNKEALAGTSENCTNRALCLGNSSNYVYSRYERTGATGDLHQAIEYAKQGLAATPQGHTGQPISLSNLSVYLGIRYERTGALDDLHQAIEYNEQALAATPDGHTNRANYLKNLSLRIYSRFGQTGDIDDLHQAIEYTKQALAATPQAHPFRELQSNGAAMLLFKRFKITRSATDIENIILLLEESWSFVSSAPSNRVQTAINLFEVFCLLSQCGDPYNSTAGSLLQKSYSILDQAVLLLPRVSPRILARQDQQFNLLDFSEIAESAASCALMAGKDAAHALTLLELSRGIIMGFAIDCRGDLSELKIANLKLYDTFTYLRNLIDTPPLDQSNDLIDSSSGAGLFSKAEARHRETTYAQQKREKAISEMEQTIAKIRELPGHEGFQLPAAPEQLMAMAKDGPIVVFISSPLRSDAIIVTSSTINSIMLPELHYNDIRDRLGKITGLTEGKRRTCVARNKAVREILCWLWNVAVEPVVRALELTVKSAGDPDLAHIWWIGVGNLSMAPFHAAGNYSNSNSQDNILNYAISSYTPTIKALAYARERDMTLADGKPDSKLLLISMTETPGGGRLPDAAEEVNEIIQLTNGSILATHLDQPNAETVLDQLKGGSFKAIHFACHGVTDNTDPSGSHLVLFKDGKADKLTVEDISGRSIGGAQLAYLSACSTAKNPQLRLADETIHIASAFQLAGFSHVIATMWPAESLVCREISKDFYRSLFDGKLVSDGHRKVRIALHGAVKRTQEKYPHNPLKWAPFIHMGA